MTVGLHKYAGQKVRQRGSSPKFQVLNGAFMTCQSELSFDQAKKDHAYWGRLVESAVGAHLVNESYSEGVGVYYWREGEKEVDFVVQHGKSISAIEVKSASVLGALSGMDEFSKKFKPKKMLLVGGDGIPVGDFLGQPIAGWIK
jgi:predicted AAA+ superfamily ATPase